MFVSFDLQMLLASDTLTMRYVIITISCIIMIFKILPIQGGPLSQHDPLDTVTMRNHYHIIHWINTIIVHNSVNPGRTIYPTWAPKRCLPPHPPQRWLLPQTPPPLRKIFTTIKKYHFSFIYSPHIQLALLLSRLPERGKRLEIGGSLEQVR